MVKHSGLLGIVVVLGLCLASAYESQAQGWPVYDNGNFLQSQIALGYHIKTYAGQVIQLANDVEKLRYLLATTVYLAQNLKQLPASVMADMNGSGSKMTGLLAASGRVSFALAQSQAQFDALYPRATLAEFGIGTPQSTLMLQKRLQMLQARQDTTRIGVQTTSVLDDMVTHFKELQNHVALQLGLQGNLDAQQLAAQQRAQQEKLALKQQQMQAVHDRLVVMQQAEEMRMTELRLKHEDAAFAVPPSQGQPYEAKGLVVEYGAWYRK